MKKTSLKITGIHCKSCEVLIKEELADLGVKKCDIDHKSGTAKIEFDESGLKLELIKSAIRKQGYGVE